MRYLLVSVDKTDKKEVSIPDEILVKRKNKSVILVKKENKSVKVVPKKRKYSSSKQPTKKIQIARPVLK